MPTTRFAEGGVTFHPDFMNTAWIIVQFLLGYVCNSGRKSLKCGDHKKRDHTCVKRCHLGVCTFIILHSKEEFLFPFICRRRKRARDRLWGEAHTRVWMCRELFLTLFSTICAPKTQLTHSSVKRNILNLKRTRNGLHRWRRLVSEQLNFKNGKYLHISLINYSIQSMSFYMCRVCLFKARSYTQ